MSRRSPWSATDGKTRAFLRMARPHFLGGGLLLYGLGVVIARYEGVPIDGARYMAGQVFVTSVQLMTHFVNEYWDVAGDRANRSRTFFSGGSGVLRGAGGLLERRTAFAAALVCLVIAFAAAFALALSLHVSPVAWLIMLLALAVAWCYSAPPLRLVASGFGEIVTSLLVAVLLPAFGYVLQAGILSPLVFWSTAPLAPLHFAMLLAFALPDEASDKAADKRTLLVRLGRTRGILVHQAALLAGYGLLAAAAYGGVPVIVVLSGMLTFPLALAQGATVHWLAAGGDAPDDDLPHYGWLTVGGVALFALTAGLITFGFWRLR
jgi:1,4-dihydroxy-2-naphthoate polyprenyltransferase